MDFDLFKAVFIVGTIAVLLGSLVVPVLRVVAGLICLGLCTAVIIGWVWASSQGRNVDLLAVGDSFLLISSIGVAELVWGHRTTRRRAAT